jgi:hypothetical protein
MRNPISNQFRRPRVVMTLLASFALFQQVSCEKANNEDDQPKMRPDLTSTQLPECVVTPLDRGWREVALATVATMHLPQDARPVTNTAVRVGWRLDDYGGVGYSLRSSHDSSIPEVITDSESGRKGWCIGGSAENRFLARVLVGHRYTSFGRHVEAHWALSDGRELVLSGVTDTAAGNVLLQIATSVRLK